MSTADMLQAVLAALPAAATGYVLAHGFARARTSQPAQDATGRRLLRYSRVWGVLFVGFIALTGVLAGLPPEVGWGAPLTTRVICLSGASIFLFGAMGIYGILEFAFVSVTMSDTGLESHSPWTGDTVISWEAVHEVTFSRFCQWFKIQAHDGSRVYASALLLGITSLAAEIRVRVPAERIRASQGFITIGVSAPELPNQPVPPTGFAGG